MVEELEKLVVLGPKGSFELASKPELKVEPINNIFSGTGKGLKAMAKTLRIFLVPKTFLNLSCVTVPASVPFSQPS